MTRKPHKRWGSLVGLAVLCLIAAAVWELGPPSLDSSSNYPASYGGAGNGQSLSLEVYKDYMNDHSSRPIQLVSSPNPTAVIDSGVSDGLVDTFPHQQQTTVTSTADATAALAAATMPGNTNNQRASAETNTGDKLVSDGNSKFDDILLDHYVDPDFEDPGALLNDRNPDGAGGGANQNSESIRGGINGAAAAGGQAGNSQQQQNFNGGGGGAGAGDKAQANANANNGGVIRNAASAGTTVAKGTANKFVNGDAARPHSTTPAKKKEGKSALYISFHEGTAVDFNYVAKKLGIPNVDWKFPRSQNLPHLTKDPYAVSSEVANAIWQDYEKEACALYDYIVIGDTIPAAGRAFIEGLLGLDSDFQGGPKLGEPSSKVACKARVVLLVTTRFDYYHFMDKAYRASFHMVVSRGLVKVLANNPFEEWYMYLKGIEIPGGVPVVRPHGQGWKEWRTRDHAVAVAAAAAAQGVRAAERDPRFRMPAVVANRERELPLVQALDAAGIQYELLQNRYGGPFALAQYLCLIHAPYQVSTMSFYENLAAGVVIFVPDIPFLKVLDSYKEFFLPEEITSKSIPWHLVEWYTPYFDPVIIKFSSVQHLQELLETTDFDAQRKKVLDFMANHEKLVLDQWKHVLFDK